MPWPFKRERDPEDAPFARHLVAAHESWEERIEQSRAVEDSTRVVLHGATAGAMVALGSYVMSLRVELEEEAPPARGGGPDRMLEFAERLDDARAAEAAYRVATWALISQYVAHVFRDNYDYEMLECGKAFGFESLYEETTVHYGKPADGRATEDEETERLHDIVKVSLYGMVSAVLGDAIEPEDDSINEQLEAWIEQFSTGLEVGEERLEQLAPDGLGG